VAAALVAEVRRDGEEGAAARDVRALADAALLALVIDGPAPSPEARAAAAALARVPRWQGRALGVDGLVAECHVPPAWAEQVAGLYELASRHPASTDMPAIESLNDAMLPFENLRSSRVEVAAVLLLDAERRPHGVHTVGVGTVNRVSMTARDVFAPALQRDVAAIILAHTHPSGDPRPSRKDKELTSLLRDAADMVGIELVDHLILAPRRSYSFAEREGWRTAPHASTSGAPSEIPARADLPMGVAGGVLEAACSPNGPQPPRADTMTSDVPRPPATRLPAPARRRATAPATALDLAAGSSLQSYKCSP